MQQDIKHASTLIWYHTHREKKEPIKGSECILDPLGHRYNNFGHI